jgi:ketosteroid isomerase-like protein
MSQENVEIVRRIYDLVNAAGLGAVEDFIHPDAEVVPPPIWPEGSTLRGRDQIREFAHQWRETFEEFKVEPERYLDSGRDGVVVYVRDHGRIKGSPAQIDTRVIHVWTLAGGKVIRWQLFTDERQALEAAGLRE